MKRLKNLIETIWSACALNSLCSIFHNDEHEIVSDRGWEILNGYEE